MGPIHVSERVNGIFPIKTFHVAVVFTRSPVEVRAIETRRDGAEDYPRKKGYAKTPAGQIENQSAF
jgi:hypothetical protein